MAFKFYFLLFCLFSILGFGCNFFPQNTEANQSFVDAYNAGKEDNRLKDIYLDSSALWINGRFHHGKNELISALNHLSAISGPIRSVESTDTLWHDDKHFFESGFYLTKGMGKSNMFFLIAWTKSGDGWQRELEIICPLEKNIDPEVKNIDLARAKWMEFSNGHDPVSLANKVYTENGIYFNQGSVFTGRTAIAERYAYMSNPDWKIDLIPDKIKHIRNSISIETGTYISGGTGHYIIVWEKQGSGEWQAGLDFNF